MLDLCEGVRVRFTDAGHLLGSSEVELWLTEGDVERKIVFSGDLGNIDQPIIRDPSFVEEADYVVMESTYGEMCIRDRICPAWTSVFFIRQMMATSSERVMLSSGW